MSAPAVPPALPGTTGRLPDFFLVGHEKCGTTSLYAMLRRHPQVYMPDLKEPRFFYPEVRSIAPERDDNLFTDTLEAYLALFAPAAPSQLVGEASPQYLRSPDAAGRIAELCPDARIIAILREPASFLRSFHMQCVQAGRETQKDLRKALELEGVRRQGKRLPRGYSSPAWLLYSEHVRYVEQLRRFHAEFPREHVLVLIYDDYRRDNQGTLRAVQRFLQIDDTVPIDSIQVGQTNSTVRFPLLHPLSRRLRLAWHRPEEADPIARTAAALAPRSMRRLWRRLFYTQPPAPDEQLTLELRRRLEPEVAALSEYLGRDLLSLWAYDRL
ncbi:MAG TPA: sulfotransferase [Solirubrobacteraceae bacterium]|nr:sulfotransferase [Solirubrobacteraceae bacterium]